MCPVDVRRLARLCENTGGVKVTAGSVCLRSAEKIYEEPVRAWDTFGNLAEESDARVDVHAFSITRVDQRAVEVRLAGIVHGQYGGVFWIKLRPVVESALLHPALEVVLRDFVRAIEKRIVRLEKFDGRIFVGDARELACRSVRNFRRIR